MELDVDVAPGTPFLSAMPVGDARLVVDVLPNRPDLLSHLGLAREIAAVSGNSMHLPDIGVSDIAIPEPKRFRRAGNAGGIVLHLEDAKLASRYMGVVIRGVTVGAEPAVARRATRGGGLALDQQRRGRDELRAPRARPADARVRSREGRSRAEDAGEDDRRALGEGRRDARHARRRDANAHAGDDGHRRFGAAHRARRRDGRRRRRKSARRRRTSSSRSPHSTRRALGARVALPDSRPTRAIASSAAWTSRSRRARSSASLRSSSRSLAATLRRRRWISTPAMRRAHRWCCAPRAWRACLA